MTDEQFAEWVEERLSQVDSRLGEVIAPQTDFVREAGSYLVSLGGKRFRPALVIAAGGLGLDADGGSVPSSIAESQDPEDTVQDAGEPWGPESIIPDVPVILPYPSAVPPSPAAVSPSSSDVPLSGSVVAPSSCDASLSSCAESQDPESTIQDADEAQGPESAIPDVPLILPYPSVAQPSFCAESQDPVSGDGLNESALIDSAVAVELTHVASLYHDDVMDEAPRRRGAPSANVRWGNSVAIMVGDFLLATASLVGSSLGEAFVAHQSRTLARLVQGQIAELRGPLDGADPVTHHLSVLSDKTASLIAASARYGGMVAGLPDDQIEELTAFGESLGMAFQLADDLIDILSDDSGKTKGTDLREGVLTLAPLMVITENRPEDGRLVALLSGPVSEEDVPEALALLRVHPALDKVRHHIAEHTRLACSHLEVFPDSPAKRALITLADQAVYRTS